MATVNNFSVRVPEGSESDDSYVTLRYGTKYRLLLINGKAVRCNAKVEIDGKHQGTWQIEAGDRIILERPAQDEACFTFYKLESKEAQQVELSASPNLGLIKVTFTPELVRQQPEITRSYGGGQSVSFKGVTRGVTRGMSAGGTGLSGHSDQNFGRAERMELDDSQQTVIHLRLVAASEDEPRPLRSFSNPIPPSVY